MTSRRRSSQTVAPQKLAEPRMSTAGWLAIVCIAMIVGILVEYLVKMNKAFDLSIDKNGSFVIKVQADETLAQVLNKAMEKNRNEVDAILASQQYYSLKNPDLVDRLEHLDASKPETEEISNRLRRLLWDLRGPFEIPYTLSGADERMTQALDALETGRKQTRRATPLLVALWKASLEGQGIFWPRSFTATIEIVHGAPTGNEDRKVVLACPGDAIAQVSGVVMLLRTDRHGDSRSILADVDHDPSLFDCGGAMLTAGELLAKEGTARLGVGETVFRELVPAGESQNRDEKVSARFVLYSKYMVSSR